MAAREEKSATAIDVINRLLRLRPDGRQRLASVTWPMGEGCRIWFSLADASSSRIPFMGLVLPETSALCEKLQRRIGMRLGESVDWTQTPAISWPVDFLAPVDDAAMFQYLANSETPDNERTGRIVSLLLEAERKLLKDAGDLRRAMDWLAQLKARHPAPPWIVPVGYYQLGLRSEGRACADRYIEAFAEVANPQLIEIYQRFVQELETLS